jgi:hypothetical protein
MWVVVLVVVMLLVSFALVRDQKCLLPTDIWDAHKICIVGNGPSALKNKRGKMIDSCDRVIRMNDFVLEGYDEFIGSKTDVWFTGLGAQQLKREQAPCKRLFYYTHKRHNDVEALLSEKLEKHNDLLVHAIKGTRYEKHVYDQDGNKRVEANTWSCFTPESIQKNYGLRAHPSTGFAAVAMAVENKAQKKLYDQEIVVTGFDAKTTGQDQISHYFNRNTKNLVHHDFFNEYKALQSMAKRGQIDFLTTDGGSPAGTDQSVDCVIATCNDADGVLETKEVVKKVYGPHVRFFVYEKCQGVHSSRGETTFLANTGREQHTYTLHIQNHYDDLADVIIFTPSNIRKKNRETRYDFLRKDFKRPNCIRGKTEFSSLRNWTKAEYQGRSLDEASPIGLENWARFHIGNYPADNTSICRHGTFVTTRELVQRTPKQTFLRLTEQLDRPEPEAGHYMERLVAMLYQN